MTNINKKVIADICEDLGFGFLDEVLKTLKTELIPSELLENTEIKEAAIRGIRQHLIDSRGEGNINTAIRIRDLFGIANKEVEEDAKWGIENWMTDHGFEFGEKIRQAFGVEEQFMESKKIQEARSNFERLHSEHKRGMK